MNWITSCILMMTCVALPAQRGSANVPVLTAAQAKQMTRMQDMRWLPTLSAKQVGEVRLALGSVHGMVVEPAVHNVVLHHLDDLVPMIEDRVSRLENATTWPFCKICVDALKAGRDPFEQFRQVLTTELPGDEFIPNCDLMDYCRLVRHMVTSLVVIQEIRAVRAGVKKTPDVTGLVLSPFEAKLVKFSRFDTVAAIDSIVRELAQPRVTVTLREYVLVQVLQTYDVSNFIDPVLSKLGQIVGSDGYGVSLLLGSLSSRCDKLDKVQRAKLRSIIESIRQHNPKASLENMLSSLESQL